MNQAIHNVDLLYWFMGEVAEVTGITATLAVALVPMAVYGLQLLLGLWPDEKAPLREYHRIVDWRWLLMELATLAVAAVALWRCGAGGCRSW